MKLGEYYTFPAMRSVSTIEFRSEKRKEWKYYVPSLSAAMFSINMVAR